MRSRALPWIAGTALSVLGVWAVFGRSLSHPFVYDDFWTIVHNPAIRSLENPLRFFLDRDVSALPETGMTSTLYRPLPTLTFALDRWAGLEVGGLRAVNLALHAANGVLAGVWLLGLGFSAAGAALGAAAFLFHPAQVETVVWLTQRSNLLTALGILGALAAFSRRRWGSGFGGLALGLLSKEVAAVFPALLAGQDAAGFPRPFPHRRRIYLGALLCVAAYLVLRTAVVGPPVQRGYQESGPVGHLLIGAVSWLMYLRILLWPAGLRVSYHQWFENPWTTPWTLAGLAAVAAWVGLVIRAWRTDRRLAVFFGMIPIAMAPVLGLFPTDTFVAERFLYLPMAGVAGVVAWAADRTGPIPRRWARTALALGVTVWAGFSWRQTGIWRDEVTLWTVTAERDPRNAFARLCRAQSLWEAGRSGEAERDFLESLRLGLTRPQAAGALTGLAQARWAAGDPAGAAEWAEKSLAADPASRPAQALRILGLARSGRKTEARRALQESTLAEHDRKRLRHQIEDPSPSFPSHAPPR